MYLSRSENAFDRIHIDVTGEQTSNTIVPIRIDSKYNGLEVVSTVFVSDFIQDKIVIDSLSVDTTVSDGFASVVLPFRLMNSLQSSTYRMKVTLSYNGNTVSTKTIIVKKEV